MSRTKPRATTWIGWGISALLIACSVWLWTERQFVIDAIQYQQYTPTDTVRQLASDVQLTDDAIFTFYATHPAIQSREAFNSSCPRREPDSPILGCYAMNRVYVFDITDERLEGIQVITAAHELLHAEYDRLSENEKKKLKPLLESEFKRQGDNELAERMKYYERTEPGQAANELHSIVGTEFALVSPELERHFARYFKNRSMLVSLHASVNQRFDLLKTESDELVRQIESLAALINSTTDDYNEKTNALNQAVRSFNSRAKQDSGFSSKTEFDAARQTLMSESNRLSVQRQKIQSDISQYKTLLTKLNAINNEAASLNDSLDSTLSDAPKL